MEDPRRPQGKFPNQGGFNHGNQMTGARIPQGKNFRDNKMIFFVDHRKINLFMSWVTHF